MLVRLTGYSADNVGKRHKEKKNQKKRCKDGMQKLHKQGRKIIYKAPSLHLHFPVKDVGMAEPLYIYLHFYLLVFFWACHPYIHFCF